MTPLKVSAVPCVAWDAQLPPGTIQQHRHHKDLETDRSAPAYPRAPWFIYPYNSHVSRPRRLSLSYGAHVDQTAERYKHEFARSDLQPFVSQIYGGHRSVSGAGALELRKLLN